MTGAGRRVRRAGRRPVGADTRRWLPATALALLAGCTALPTAQGPPAHAAAPTAADAAPALPEITTGTRTAAGTGRAFARHAVAAAHPLAVQAGLQVLRAGGNALDAAIATQFALGVVEPQSSGIGGGGFLLWWDGQQLHAWDGRETAPASATPALFLRPDGRPLGRSAAQRGGLPVGAPGLVPMLHAAHARHGRLPWAALLAPAIALAEAGFAVTPRLHALIEDAAPALRADPQTAAWLFPLGGDSPAVGALLRNPALAAVLRAVAAEGAAALQQGPVAADIARRVQQHAQPGRLTAADLAAYRPLRRTPLCTDWDPAPGRAWRVCGMPPPSSGHLALMQILGLLGDVSVPPGAATPWQDAAVLHRYLEASRLAFADRDHHVADPAFVPAPGGRWEALLAPAYLQQRAQALGPRAMGTAAPGAPDGAALAGTASAPQPPSGTTHLSVVDAQGRVVALTSSIEAAFGAKWMSDGGTGLPGGFFLNNQLTDFSFTPTGEDGLVANRVQPGKRPRSSMSPTLVFDRASGQPVLTLGSALGPIIIHGVARSLLATGAWGLTLQQAFELPTAANLNGPTLLETDGFAPALVQALRALGHEVLTVPLGTGLHGLQRVDGGWLGAADPRREGTADGD